MTEKKTKISIVILTYNRHALLRGLLRSLCTIGYSPLEVVVVDNHSEKPIGDMIASEFPFVTLLQMNDNIGVAARNRGLSYASGDIIITIDDDISGIETEDMGRLSRIFLDPKIGAVCFKVLHGMDRTVSNWCHHRPSKRFSDKTFITDEITEGAVAFRRSALMLAGLYPENFFISHEGPDLAYRIMNKGFYVLYSPEVTVLHYNSKTARKNWRRYYYDTRNLIWLAARNYPLGLAMKRLSIGLAAMFIYSIRDGFSKYWFKAVKDGIFGLKAAFRERTAMSERTLSIVRGIEKRREGFFVMIRKRLFQREIRI